MMADIYDRARAQAIRMLSPRPTGKGLALVLRVHGDATYAPGGGGAIGTITDHTGSGMRVRADHRDIDGVTVLMTDAWFLVSPDGVPEPKPGDSVVFDGATYTVIACKPWNYAGTDCGYRVQARK